MAEKKVVLLVDMDGAYILRDNIILNADHEKPFPLITDSHRDR
jgi:hypothetical protein